MYLNKTKSNKSAQAKILYILIKIVNKYEDIIRRINILLEIFYT